MLQIEIAGKYDQPPRPRRITPVVAIFLPFAAGYFLSCWMRVINGSVADELVSAFGLGPRDLGVLTSLYFLAFAALQLPAGMLIDRYGPRRVQSGLFLVAAAGSLIFAVAQSSATLMLGRLLMGLGCSAALTAGIKALAAWLPPERRALGNCAMVMCGGLGAMASATTGDWRAMSVGLGLAALAVVGLVWAVAPENSERGHAKVLPMIGRGVAVPRISGLAQIMRDRRFWRVAPLSAAVVGAAFAIHGLWAARWLADVELYAPTNVARVLLAMGASLTLGAAVFGLLATQLRRWNIPATTVLAGAASVFLAVQAVIALGVPVPPMLSLVAVAMFGAITVLTFTIIGELFPAELVGRANGALNMLQLGAAFAMQVGIGATVSLWPVEELGKIAAGHPPAVAYAAAFGVVIAVQAAALVWFLASPVSLARPGLRLAWVAPEPKERPQTSASASAGGGIAPVMIATASDMV